MKTYWGKAGTPITIPCSINLYNEENFSLDWRKDGQLILSAFGQEQGHVTPTLQGKKTWPFRKERSEELRNRSHCSDSGPNVTRTVPTFRQRSQGYDNGPNKA
ncbi:hypothetical protein B9Z55_024521 [Caenorhabditis nigoni]|uniref:Uncharacterized protein n=1 Tax=Caenorhabditis nigoni TaxID=1611254 RepID=A0A2G5SUU0_9PELO|nr:hypothetical protein B9Z55_024521 [Caenorhabditis nigoni]